MRRRRSEWRLRTVRNELVERVDELVERHLGSQTKKKSGDGGRGAVVVFF